MSDKVEIMFMHEEIKMERIITLEKTNITYIAAARASRVSVSARQEPRDCTKCSTYTTYPVRKKFFSLIRLQQNELHSFDAAVFAADAGKVRHNEFNNSLENLKNFTGIPPCDVGTHKRQCLMKNFPVKIH